jgi:hypothetical protein
MALERMGKTGQAMAFQQEARSNPMGALEMARGPQGLQAAPPPQGLQAAPPQGATGGMSPGAMGGQAPIPQFVPDEPPRPPKITKVGQILDRQVIDKDGNETDLTTEIFEAFIDKMPSADTGSAMEKMLPKDNVVAGMVDETRNEATAASGGGLMQLAAGGEFTGRVPGDGHGMEDNVRMPIKEGEEQVATLAVSPTEYVVDSYTMAALGNGNPDEGADVMDAVVENVREKAYGTNQQPNEINGLAALRPMIERV